MMLSSSRRSLAFPLHVLVSCFRTHAFFAPAAAFSLFLPTTRQRRFSAHSAIFRGDYAGYHATYDIDGTHIPLPEFYVPQALLDWGQAPLAFEVVVSENEDDDNARHVLTVLPETGCGLDNLEVLQRRETLGKPLWETNKDKGREACVYVTHSAETSRVECVFALPHQHRSRVVLHCDPLMGTVKKPLSLYLERQISETSTKGRRADGGGLDARSVSGWIGTELRAMESSLKNNNMNKATTWHLGESENTFQHVFGLPGNVTVAFDSNEQGSFTVRIGQAYKDDDVDPSRRRLIELDCRRNNNEWVARSWLETLVDDGDSRSRSCRISNGAQTTRVECVFALSHQHRSRVVLHCDLVKGTVKKPVSLYLERQISETSTEGRRAEGGGLDARSVSGWIGTELRAMESSLNNEATTLYLGALDGTLKHVFGLPGNVTVAFDCSEQGSLTVRIGQAYNDDPSRRLIELYCRRNNEWVAQSWLEAIVGEPR